MKAETLARLDISLAYHPIPRRARFNLDGLLTYATAHTGGLMPWYTQIFRDGVIEAVDAHLLEPRTDDPRKFIPVYYLEDYLIKALTDYLSILKSLRLSPPFLVMLTLLGVKDFLLYLGEYFRGNSSHAIDRDILAIPDILIEDFETDLKQALRPAFDALWQSAGVERSLSYDEHRNWVRKENFAR